ncbi:MAG: hypothetical protein GF364_04520 [Candidatus Lokiarchaeota archaeon]|nr:hypothetical protein [Candidatus Lokiarchaeota archaeon]
MTDVVLVISTAFTAIIMSITAAVTFYHSIVHQNKLMFVFSLNWALQAVFWYLDMTAHITVDALYMRIGFVFQSIAMILLLVYLEYISNERINPFFLSLASILATLYIIVSWLDSSMEEIEGYGVHVTGVCRIIQILFFLYSVLIYFRWSYKTWIMAPDDIKRSANLLLVGSILYSFGMAIVYFLGTFIYELNAIAFNIHAIGIFFTVIVMIKERKLIYVLPFKAFRLVVFETKGGLLIYSYNWTKSETLIHEDLFSSVLQGISSILRETLNKGNLKKIQLDDAILMLNQNPKHSIAFGIVSTKDSKILRSWLRAFEDKFLEKYGDSIETPTVVSNFDQVEQLVKDSFAFIPQYN